MLPCPLCGEWVSAPNNSRHYKDKHGTTPKEVLTQPDKWEIAQEMAEVKREQIRLLNEGAGEK